VSAVSWSCIDCSCLVPSACFK